MIRMQGTFLRRCLFRLTGHADYAYPPGERDMAHYSRLCALQFDKKFIYCRTKIRHLRLSSIA